LVAVLLCGAGPIRAAVPGTNHTVKLSVQTGYLPQIPVLVRVELRDSSGRPDRSVWNADATLSETAPGITLSTNRIALRNGVGTGLITITGSGDFQLQATIGPVQATRSLRDLSAEPVTRVGGTLTGSATTWNGVVNITNDLTVPTGHVLTIESNALVLINGVASGTVAPDIFVNGSIQSLGTESQPVTITCANSGLRWGQIRHDNAQPSLYRFTTITMAGRASGEGGHTGTGPAIRPSNSRLVFENCNITDHADNTGGPGKIMIASGSDLVFTDCVMARSRMGPEVSTTALLCSNTWIMHMRGPDDADGIYVHDQSAGQQVLFTGCVIVDGDDDGIDTLGSIVNVENCIIRDWASRVEDAKGISVFNGATRVRRCLIVDSTVGVAAKWSGGSPTLVTIDSSTFTGNLTNVWANKKSNAIGPFVDFRITNCVLWGGDSIQSDFGVTNFTIGYCDISEAWPGTENLMVDPLFVDAAAHDFHLRIGSPCIDTGDPAFPVDADGSRADIGLYPFEVPRPVLGLPQSVGGAFEFRLSAYTNRNYAIDYSTNARTWGTLSTISHTVDPETVSDPSGAAPMRIYRARLVP
jgi:hypothetical protein